MKKAFYAGKLVPVSKATVVLVVCFGLLTTIAHSQGVPANTYFSSFSDPAGKYTEDQPSCILGTNSPNINNAQNVASGTLADFASQSFSVLNLNLCLNGVYRLTANLNIGALSQVPASPGTPYYAGFKVGASEVAKLGLAASNFQIVTYLGNTRKQSSGANLLGLNLLSSGLSNIEFIATEPFDRVAVEVSAGLLSLDVGRIINFYYAYASTSTLPVILPVKLTSFSASATGKNVVVNWVSASESNTARYELQRSTDNGNTFSTVATIPAKGNIAAETKYSYTDGTALNGQYTYRLKMIDKDEKAEYSKLAPVKLISNINWKVYPTLLSSGTDLSVSFANNSKAQVQLTNLQGQVLHTASTATGSKITVPTSGLAAGVYMLKLYNNGQLQTSEKVVIQ